MCDNRDKLIQFVNCRILRDHKITKEDLWVRNGQIVNPEKVFFDEKIEADQKIDCNGNIIAPGFIEIQINGGFGYDFSTSDTKKAIEVVSKNLLAHGITSYCPTVVTSPKEVYHRVLPNIKKGQGGKHGASILGVHVEGPFINVEKKGAHPPEYIVSYEDGIKTVEDMYGSLENIKIITLAPEFANSGQLIKELCSRGIIVSLGHSTADLKSGEEGAKNGATLITHLFNAMLPFHHRDPGLVGLLASCKIKNDIFYGIIADNIHTHPAALRIAHRVCPAGLVLVTDAISALGLEEGEHAIGQMRVEIKDGKAMVAGTNTLCGSIAPMTQCVKNFIEATGCSKEFALEAASLHPAQALKIDDKKGTLNFGSDADFVILNDQLDLLSTWIAGERVFSHCN